MRYVEDGDLSLCMTVSTGVGRDEILKILGAKDQLPEPKSFDDFPKGKYKPGKTGLLNVIGRDNFLVTLENSGFLGVTHGTMHRVATLTVRTLGHFTAVLFAPSGLGYQYVEVEDGLVVANFDPMSDNAPDAVEQFFTNLDEKIPMRMISALAYRMEVPISDGWLSEKTDTYEIDYRVDRERH